MTERVSLDHSALRESGGRELEDVHLTDQEKVAVLLQGAALLAHLAFGRQRLVDGWRGAKIGPDARLMGLAAAPGVAPEPSSAMLRALARRLFSSRDTVAGRGAGRRAVRHLLELWRHDLAPIGGDEAVTQVLSSADFLWRKKFGAARASLAAVHASAGREVLWVAGPGDFRSSLLAHATDRAELTALLMSDQAERLWRRGRRDPAELLASGNWRAAAAAWQSRVPRTADERLRYARILFGLARFESARGEVARLRSAEARLLRAACLHRLGRLRAARREVERLGAVELGSELFAEAADVAVRLYGNLGLPDRAAEWTARAIERAEGDAERGRAELVGFAAAWDRGDRGAMERHLGAAERLTADPDSAWLWYLARGQSAIARGDGKAAVKALSTALATCRRRLSPLAAGNIWNELALGRGLVGDLAGAERALLHALRLHREAEGPRRTTLSLFNLAEIRLRRGRLAGVAEIVRQSMRENRQAGNRRGLVHDRELQVRYELVRGRPSAALAAAMEAVAESEESCAGWRGPELRVLAARALGWLGREEEAGAELELAGRDALAELEPEERPALLLLAGEREAALGAVDTGPAAAVWRALLTGAELADRHWERAAELEPYRFARLVFDLESIEPGRVPPPLMRRAATTLRRTGAGLLAERLEIGARSGWAPVASYLESGDRSQAAVCRLLEEVGGGEIGLVRRSSAGGAEETLVAGPASGERLCATLDGSELRLTAPWIDPLVRVLFQLAVRACGGSGVAVRTAGAVPAGGIVGRSRSLRDALERVELLAPEPVPVLLRGETGTGKELVARRIHALSARAEGPFVAFNCAAVSRDLLMSDLFGHVRGAFTSAIRDRAGIFETARDGTVFLDEIGDLPLTEQGLLLRVLQEGEVRRVGESLPRSTDVRVIAASHRDLDRMVRDGAFRADLYFRLRVASVELPPLRQRGDDVLELAEHFLDRLRPGGPPELVPAARAALLGHDWPGNVRQLANVLSVAVALAAGGPIRPEHLELGAPQTGARLGYHEQVLNYRRRLVEEALAASDGNLAAAARRLGLSRQALSYLVRKLGVDR